MNHVSINQEVSVTGYYFRNKNFQTVPSGIEYGGNRVSFLNQSMQYFVQKGQQFVKLFDVTDGDTTYRLKYEPEQLQWTLVYTANNARTV